MYLENRIQTKSEINIEETNTVRALEYKEHYEDLVNDRANFLKQKIENIKSAASVVIELENKREPLLDKIETIQSQIAEIELEVSDFEVTMTQEQRENLANLNAEKEKLQKEYDNFSYYTLHGRNKGCRSCSHIR